MKKLSKSIERVDCNVVWFGLLPDSRLSTNLTVSKTQKGTFQVSVPPSPYQDPIPRDISKYQSNMSLWPKTHLRPHSRPIQDPQNCARRAYGKVNKTPSLKKSRITKTRTLKRKKLTKTKAKEMIPPWSEDSQNLLKTWCYQERSWSSFATEEEGDNLLTL